MSKPDIPPFSPRTRGLSLGFGSDRNPPTSVIRKPRKGDPEFRRDREGTTPRTEKYWSLWRDYYIVHLNELPGALENGTPTRTSRRKPAPLESNWEQRLGERRLGISSSSISPKRLPSPRESKHPGAAVAGPGHLSDAGQPALLSPPLEG